MNMNTKIQKQKDKRKREATTYQEKKYTTKKK